MKKKYIALSAFVLSAGMFSFNNHEGSSKISKFHILNPGGKSGSYAGAPGDNNCTECHTGNTQSGSSVNSVIFTAGVSPVTSYTPNSTYNVTLTMTPNPAKKGFQAVAMDGSGNVVGTVSTVALGGAQIMSGRATHQSSSNTNANAAWVWSWTAPATDVGDVTFYVASMSANGSGTSGDVVYLSQHVFGSLASIDEVKAEKYNFSAGYSSATNSVVMDFNSLVAGETYFNLVDLNGRSVFTYNMGNAQVGKNNQKIVLPNDLKNGMYIVNMFVNNNAMSQKIMIQK
jgi:hypothetical protein